MMRLQVSDALYVEMEKRARYDDLPVDAWAEQQLERIKDHSVKDRIVIVGRDARETLETQLGGGALQSDDDLVAKVQRLAVLEIGELVVNFSPGQWEEFARRCKRTGVDPQAEAQRIVTKISELFFDHVGA